MTLGAITRQVAAGQRGGPVIMERVTIVGDDSYPTGGTTGIAALVSAALGRGSVTVLAILSQNLSDHRLLYDQASDTLLVQLISTQAEVADTTNLSGITFEALVVAF